MSAAITYKPFIGKRSRWAILLVVVLVAICLLPIALIGSAISQRATLSYEVTPDELVIHHSPTTTHIRRESITSVYTINPTHGTRLMGTSMDGYHQGRFTFRETGMIYLYSSTTNPLTVIVTPERQWGISPADPVGFESALAAGRPGLYPPIQAGTLWGMARFLLIILPLMALAIGTVIYYVTLAPTIAYTLTESGLVITARWRRIEIPYGQIHQVEIASPKGHSWKLAGAGLPGLYWGSFSWKAAGTSVRMYATREKPVVLLRTQRHTIAITPVDDQGFVAELQRRLPRST